MSGRGELGAVSIHGAGDIEECDFGFGNDASSAGAGREQHCSAEAEAGITGGCFESGVACQRDQDMEAVVAGDGEGLIALVAVDLEAAAGDKFFEGVVIIAAGVWDDG